MAKLKIRKLLADKRDLVGKLDNTLAMLAFLVHKNGGELQFTKKDLESLPDAGFSVHKEEEEFILKLTYPDK